MDEKPNEQLELEEESYDSFPDTASGSVGMYFVDARELKHVELDVYSPCHKSKCTESVTNSNPVVDQIRVSKCTKLDSSKDKLPVELGS